jgi:hypothetical protein
MTDKNATIDGINIDNVEFKIKGIKLTNTKTGEVEIIDVDNDADLIEIVNDKEKE